MNRFEFYSKLDDFNSLSHKQSPLYGKQNPNAAYYKRIGQPGNYRYFKTKEEYDSYLRSKEQHSYSAEQAEKENKDRKIFEAKKRGKEALIKSTSDIAKNIYDNFDIKKYYNEGDDPQTVLNRIKEDGIFDEIKKNMKILYDNGYVTFDNYDNDGRGAKGWHFKDGSIANGMDIYEKIKDASWEYKDLGSVFSKLLSKNFEDSLYPPNYDPNKIYLTGATVFPDEIKEYAKKELGVDLSGDKQKILTKEQYEKINDYRKKIFG